MLRPEGSDRSTIAAHASGSTNRHRGAVTPRRSRSGRTASAAGSTPRPAPCSPAWLRGRHGRGDRPRGRHVEGDVLRALRQQGGLHRRPARRRDERRAGGDAAARAHDHARRRTRPGACAPSSTPSWRCSPPSRTRRRRCWWRSSAPGPRAMERRDRVLAEFAALHRRASTARTPSAAPRRGSPRSHDAFAIVGAVVELASRQIRTGEPERHPRPRAGGRAARARPAARVDAPPGVNDLAALEAAVHECRRCPRLVAWREQVARARSARPSATRRTGAGPSPGFGDPARADPAARPRARRARRQPHRARVHRRPLGRLPLRRAAPGRAGEPAGRRSRATTGSTLRDAGSPRRCAARRRPTSRCRPSATLRGLARGASWRCSPGVRRGRASAAFAWDAALRLLDPGRCARSRASATARRRRPAP